MDNHSATEGELSHRHALIFLFKNENKKYPMWPEGLCTDEIGVIQKRHFVGVISDVCSSLWVCAVVLFINALWRLMGLGQTPHY